MKSKLLIAVSAIFAILALPLLAQGQGQGGGQWGGQAGSFDMEEMYKQMADRGVQLSDTDDDGELTKEEFMELAANERYSAWFEADESEEDSEDEDAETDEADEASTDETEGEEVESDEDALMKLHEAKFEELDADDNGKVSADEIIEGVDFEAVMERMRSRWEGGGGRQGGGGNMQRPGGG